jgi:hypothetical protein
VVDLRIDLAFADTPRNDLGELRTEIENSNYLRHAGNWAGFRLKETKKSGPPRHDRMLRLELQAHIHMPAFRARRRVGARTLGVKVITADAVKSNFASLRIVEDAVAPVIIHPQYGKDAQDHQAIDDDIEREIGRRDHGVHLGG